MSPRNIERASAPIKNIVLVHGAWEDGWSWSKVIPLLQARALTVACVINSSTSLADGIAATRRIVNAQDGPVLLVGHAYGGAVITEAGDNPKVAGLVYIAASAPDVGETLAGLAEPFGTTPVFNEIVAIEDGFLILTSRGIAECFAQDLSSEEQQIALATQGALHGTVLNTTLRVAAWQTKPSWFIVAENDRTISPAQQHMTAERMSAKVLTLATSHAAMLSDPTQVAAFIADAAGG